MVAAVWSADSVSVFLESPCFVFLQGVLSTADEVEESVKLVVDGVESGILDEGDGR